MTESEIDVLAKPRAIEHLGLNSWFDLDYEDDSGTTQHVWACVQSIYNKTHLVTGTKVVHIVAVDTDGEVCELVQMRGHGIPRTLRAAEGRKLGLVMGGVDA